MSQAGTVARLAVRELWMTFRLLLLLFAWVAAGAVVGLLPDTPSVTLERLAIGLGVATQLSGAVAAWSLAVEREAGRAGWLVTRSVPRGTYLVGWYAAFAGVALPGLAAATALGWVALAGAPGGVDGGDYAAAVLGVAGTTAAAVALGLVAGALLRASAAAWSALGSCVLAAIGAWLAFDRLPWLPGGAHLLLVRAGGPEPIAADALRAAGIGLALAAVLLVAARVGLERSEL